MAPARGLEPKYARACMVWCCRRRSLDRDSDHPEIFTGVSVACERHVAYLSTHCLGKLFFHRSTRTDVDSLTERRTTGGLTCEKLLTSRKSSAIRLRTPLRSLR